MVRKRDMVIAVLITFCLTAMLFSVRFTRSQTPGQYDPWLDITDDGKILIDDVAWVAKAFGASGTPINKTALLLDLQSKIDSLNSSLLSLQAYFNMRITTLEATVGEQQVRIADLETELAVLNATKLGQPDYDSGWIQLPKGPEHTWLTHNLNTTEVFVYLIGNGTGSSPDTNFWAAHQGGIGGDTISWGAYWAGLNETSICIYRAPYDTEWSTGRLMIWIIP